MIVLFKRLYASLTSILLCSSLMVKTVLCYQQVFLCDFESEENCEQITQWSYPNDNFDWTKWRGLTGGAYSGPSSDHTYGNISGHYMYTQSNADRRGDSAILQIGDKLELSAGRGLLRFYYHMEDRDPPDSLGDLKVYVCQQNGYTLGEPTWIKSNSQGSRWLMAEIVFGCSGQFQVLFEGVRGTRDSDIAIDDIILLDLSIDESVPYVSTSVAMTTMAMRSPSTSVAGSEVIYDSTSTTNGEMRALHGSTISTSPSVGRSVMQEIDGSNQDPNSKKTLILFVGLTAPVFSIALLLVILGFICFIRKRRRKELEVSSGSSVDGVMNPYLYDPAGYVELQGPVPSVYTKLQVACTGVVEVDTSAYMSLQNISTTSSFKRVPLHFNSNTVPAHARSYDPPVYMDPDQFRRHSTRRIGANPTYGMDIVNQVGYYHIPDVISQANQRDTYQKDSEFNIQPYHEYYVLEKQENTEPVQPGQDELESYHADDEEDFISEKATSRMDVNSYLDLCAREEETIDSIRLSDYQADESDSDDYRCLGPNDLGFSGYQIDTQLNNLSAPSHTNIENTLDYSLV
ncbi:uncharacterized protein [Antedon mediterranea]|uniref:uncharacterized protein n=1 Tax=Antedon mediterranea TaxID=105859 RepID=UPI003AF6668F